LLRLKGVKAFAPYYFMEAQLTAEVIHLPFASGQSSPAYNGSVAAPRREYGFDDVVKLLGLRHLSARSQVGRLRDLHDQAAMPAPKNPRKWGGLLQHGSARIDRRSVWCALEFDMWQDGQQNPPPTAAAMAAPSLPTSLRAVMRQRANAIGGR
jgi:hypothetical protein